MSRDLLILEHITYLLSADVSRVQIRGLPSAHFIAQTITISIIVCFLIVKAYLDFMKKLFRFPRFFILHSLYFIYYRYSGWPVFESYFYWLSWQKLSIHRRNRIVAEREGRSWIGGLQSASQTLHGFWCFLIIGLSKSCSHVISTCCHIFQILIILILINQSFSNCKLISKILIF